MRNEESVSQAASSSEFSETSGDPSEMDLLQPAESKKLRELMKAALGFLAARKLIPAALMRVGVFRLLLPFVWGIRFIRSRRWLAGTAMISIGLLALIISLKPSPEVQTEEANVGPDLLFPVKDDQKLIVEETHDSAGEATSDSHLGGPSFYQPIVIPVNPENSSIAANGTVASEDSLRNENRTAWLLGTIEVIDGTAPVSESATAEDFSRRRQ